MTAGSAVAPAIAELLEMRRFSDPSEPEAARASQRSFSVSKTAAVLALRATHAKGMGWDPGPWDWTLYWLRAANALSGSAVAELRIDDGDERRLELEFTHPGFELASGSEPGRSGRELGDPLAGALVPDLGLPLDDASAQARFDKWRALVGRAINATLAQDPIAVELVTPLGVRRFERRAEVASGQDPYDMRAAPVPAQLGACTFRVRVWTQSAGLGAKVRAFFGGGGPRAAIASLWARRRLLPPGPESDAPPFEGVVSIAPVPPGRPIRLGGVARMGASEAMRGLFLVREGVRIVPLDAAVKQAGLARPPSGWVDAPALALNADESDVVRDEAFDLLVAWLADMQEHTHQGEGRQRVIWPERIESLSTVSGRPMSLEDLRKWISVGRELLYVFKHRQSEVPAALQARVLRVWPSELAAIGDALPNARWVPVRALGERPSLDPIDLTALEQGSFDPVSIVEHAEVVADGSEVPGADALEGAGVTLRFSARAYLHRFSGAKSGSILVLAYGRRVAHTRDHVRTVPGMTVVVELHEGPRGGRPTAKRLRTHPELLERLYERCYELVQAQAPELLRLVIRDGRAWDNPFFQEQLAQLNGVRLGLRYRETAEGLRLAWSQHPALGIDVARDDSGETLTLGDVLERVRDVGFLVLRESGRIYPRLESEDPRFGPLRLRRPARPLLERILGEEVMLRLPFVPEAQPSVGDAEVNLRLLTESTLALDDLRRAKADPRARARAQARMVVARARQADTFGAEGARIWQRFDPRALSTTRVQSLRALLAEAERPALAFPGAVSREFEGAVVEASPAVAALLAAHEGFAPARPQAPGVARRSDASTTRTSSRREPGRRRAGPALPLLRGRVEHEFAIGSITVAADGTSPGIALWSRGLKVGEVRLPEPLGRVGGRLWLTPTGRLARSRQLQGMAAEVAAELLARAPYERALLPAEDPRHGALATLVDYLRERTEQSEALGSSRAFAHLREVLSPAPDAQTPFEADVDASIRRWPLRAGPGRDRVVDLVRCALAQKAPIRRALLSWKVAELQEGRSAIELGGRNRWIKAADEDPVASFEAAALVLDTVFRDPQWWSELRGQPDARLQKHRRWALRSQFRLLARMLELDPPG